MFVECIWIVRKHNYGFACKLHAGFKIDAELSRAVSINVLVNFLINIVM